MSYVHVYESKGKMEERPMGTTLILFASLEKAKKNKQIELIKG